jgi:hypothetical protein
MKGAFSIKSKKTPYQVCSEGSSVSKADLLQLQTYKLTVLSLMLQTAAQGARGREEEGEQQQL